MGEATLRLDRRTGPMFTYAFHPRLLPAAGGHLDMWRYQALLPRPDEPVRYPLAVGGTPLRASPPLSLRVGLSDLWLKDETTGPSWSNKDRATALVIDEGLRRGARAVTTSSTGNAAIATAIGAAAAGLPAVIFVPADCRPHKVATMTAAGAYVFRVLEGYAAAYELSRSAARQFGWVDRNTGANPATVEAKKTVAFEIWEQLGRRAPDVVAVPVGDGVTCVGLAKGFRELRACGAITALPRIIAVQAAACAPLAAAYWGTRPTPYGQTAADGIAVPRPSVGDWALDEVRASGGQFVTVTEDEIAAAVRDLDELAGIPSEPAGAAATAGLCVAVTHRLVAPQETAVALVTGADRPVRPAAGTVHGRDWTIHAGLSAVTQTLAALAPDLVRPAAPGAPTSTTTKGKFR